MTKQKSQQTCGYCFENSLQDNACTSCGKTESSPDGRTLHKVYLKNDQYFVGALLGNPGGFGIVYLAYDEVLQRKVVIKEMFPNNQVHRVGKTVRINQSAFASQYEQYKVLFLEEARKLAQLGNVTAVVNITDFFLENNTAYFVMSFVEGISLAEHIKQHGGLNQHTLIDWLYQLCQGLAAIHAQNIYHNDIKPENIIIDNNNNPVLIDFGNAVSDKNKTHQSYLHAVTPAYSAPEQHAKKLSEMGAWTDIYGLGATMYHCITTKRPESSQSLLIQCESLVFNSEVKHLPSELVSLIEWCTKLKIEDRPQNVQSVLRELKPLRRNNIHWTTVLPNNNFGKQMRIIHKKNTEGIALPITFNFSAGVMQWLWFFWKNLTLGIAIVLIYGVGLVLLVINYATPATFIYFAIAFWAVLFLPTALLANYALYKSISTKVFNQLSEIEADGNTIQAFVNKAYSPNSLLLQFAIVCFLVIVLVCEVGFWRYQSTAEKVESAIKISHLKADFLKFYESEESYPNSTEQLLKHNQYTLQEVANVNYSEVLPNYKFNKINLFANQIELFLNIKPFKNKKVVWTLDEEGLWHCHSSEVSKGYLPNDCEYVDD